MFTEGDDSCGHGDTSQIIMNTLVVVPNSIQEYEVTLDVYHLSSSLYRPAIGISKEDYIVFERVSHFFRHNGIGDLSFSL
jgi:hypothetical protein